MIKKILDTLTSKQPSLAERLASEGTSNTLSHPWRTFHGLVEGDTLHCLRDQVPVPGQTFTTVDCLHPFIVVSVSPSPEEGIVSCSIEPMPASVSVHRAIAAGVTMAGKNIFRLSPTAWRDIPAQVDGLTFRLPAPYCPDPGELILHDSIYYRVISTDIESPYCICSMEVFPA